jgi:hypothetical protein
MKKAFKISNFRAIFNFVFAVSSPCFVVPRLVRGIQKSAKSSLKNLDPAIKSRDDEMWGKKLIHRELLALDAPWFIL